MPETVRLFVAIELPAATREAVAALLVRLQREMPSDALRWVRPESIHITLKFLGATPREQVSEVAAALGGVAAQASTLRLTPQGLGSFGGRRNMRVVWLGVGGDTEGLAALAASIDEAVAPLGFERERRAFAAHLTLARVRETTTPEERAALHAALIAVRAPEFEPFVAAELSLMRSTLSPSGARYETLATFRLGEQP